jgi:UDP-glucose 4-epimerase
MNRASQNQQGAGGSSVRSSVTDQLDFSRAKIEKMFGWVPEISIEEGIRRLLDWRKAQDTPAS